MTGRFVNRFRTEMKAFLQTLPGIGKSMYKIAKQAEESFKGFLTPGVLFEELGFQYIGPIEGHRLDHLVETLSNVANMEGPILVHVLTKKGKGYYPAESDPARFHGVGPFHIETGRLHKRGDGPPTYTEIFGKTIVRLAGEDDRIIAITAAMEDGTGLRGYSTRFPERFFDVGICESHAVAFAAGLARSGMRPVVDIYSTFLQRAYDQVFQEIALQDLPVLLLMDRAGLTGPDGPTHHGMFDIGYMRLLPNMTVMVPGDAYDIPLMLELALAHDGPAAMRYPKATAVDLSPDLIDGERAPVALGKAETLRTGRHGVILCCGTQLAECLEAADLLAKEGLCVGVVNARFVKPLDRETLLRSAQRCGWMVTVEDHVAQGGFGSAVLELLSSESAAPRVRVLGIGDRFVEHGDVQGQWRAAGIDAVTIADRTWEWLTREA